MYRPENILDPLFFSFSFFQIDGTSTLKEFQLVQLGASDGGRQSSGSLSPTRVFYTEFDPASSATCGDKADTCTNSYTFNNLANSACQSSFICSALDGNTCGSYGIDLNLDSHSHEVCFKARFTE